MKSQQENRSVITVNLTAKAGWEQWILLRADAHHDNLHCDHALERRHLQQAKERKALVCDFGDLFCAMQGKWDKRADQTQMRPELQSNKYLDELVAYNSAFYEPFANQFLMLSPGNHETAILKHHQTNLTERLAERLNVVRGRDNPVNVAGFSGWIRFMFQCNATQRMSKMLKWHHGYGGDAPVTKGTIQTARMGLYLPDADFVVTGHCFSEDTEILTPTGWKQYADLELGSQVATMNKETRKLEFNPVRAIHVYDDYKHLHRIQNQNVDILVTDKHGLCFEGYHTGRYGECTAAEFEEQKAVNLFTAAKHESETETMSEDMVRLIVWATADGSFESDRIRFHLKKSRKIKRLRELLERMGLAYTNNPMSGGTVKIGISVADSSKIIEAMGGNKELPKSFYSFGASFAEIVLEEYRNTDGQFERKLGTGFQLYSKNLNNINVLQALCVKAGWRGNVFKREAGDYILGISKKNTTFFKSGAHEVVPYAGKVWCVTVDNGTLMVRRNGKTVVTLNTHNEWIFPICRERISAQGLIYKDKQVHIKVPGYKDEYADGFEGWHIERGGPPKPLGAAWLRFYYEGNTVKSEVTAAD